jgi:ligand-binding SRPBCC domain-containing protein
MVGALKEVIYMDHHEEIIMAMFIFGIPAVLWWWEYFTNKNALSTTLLIAVMSTIGFIAALAWWAL